MGQCLLFLSCDSNVIPKVNLAFLHVDGPAQIAEIAVE
jgi:hypothetical protein